MIDRFKALRMLDRKRLDATLMRIHGRPVLMVFFNIVLLSINSLGLIKSRIKNILGRLGILNNASITSNKSISNHPTRFKNRIFDQQLSVLIVCEISIKQCFRYRVEQKIEQLEYLGLRNKWIDWTNYMEVNNQINFYDVIIFYRVPGYPKMIANIEYAQNLGKIVIYDTDDLIFDRQILASYYDKSTTQLTIKDLKGVLNGADLYRKAISFCPFALTTTAQLQSKLKEIVGDDAVFILPNGLDAYIDEVMKSLSVGKDSDKIYLFYGSGTKTHDQDFAMIAPVIEKIFVKHDHVNLVVVGYLSLPENLRKFDHRITKIDFLEVNEYLDLLAHADINLAPLKPGLFADCKSEIKWLEAGLLTIPTVASATKVYQEAITQGESGFVAQSVDQWHEILERLIAEPKLRQKIGKTAHQSAIKNYSIQTLADKFLATLIKIKSQHLANNQFVERQNNIKQVVIVNVLYPPQAMGGATVVAQNIVDTLSARYGDEFQVSVFTCDVNNIYAYEVNEYELNGVSVTAVSVPVGPDVDYREYDEHMEELFSQFIEYKRPDLIHFHCIQRLTASILQASLTHKIPYVVTVHDAWWLSDHQFLVDKKGLPVNSLQTNPIIASRSSENNQTTIKRKRILTALLNQADRVLAVSDYQASFYQQNAIANVVINKNGVNALPNTNRKENDHRKVVIGYSGSVCHHKGFYFLKKIIEDNQFENICLKVIQFNLSAPKVERWNQTQVDFLPKFDASNIAEFYQQIDVLIAPSMWPESFGLITREAALAGIWVIASDAGGLAELIETGDNGFKFDIGDAQQLIEILKEINSNTQKYNQRLAVKKREGLDVVSVEQHVAGLVTIYHQVLDENLSKEP